jgi:hypothetical protein
MKIHPKCFRPKWSFIKSIPDLGAAHHLDARVVDVHHVLQDDLVVVQLDSLRDAGDGEKFLKKGRYNVSILINVTILFMFSQKMLKHKSSLEGNTLA